MADERDAISEVVMVLDELGVPYIIGGSIALSVWAVPRMTHDLDVVVDMHDNSIHEFCSQLSSNRYYLDEDAMRDAFSKRDQTGQGMYSFLDMETNFKIDLFPLRPDDAAQVTAFERRTRANVLKGVEAYVYSPADLLIQKLRWYAASESERQFADCVNLMQTDLRRDKPLIDRDYLQAWTARLGPSVEKARARLVAVLDQLPS
ncbi:MAG TPA: nucleotidyl transferase AbiEii/AbiGii toxin family protein [Chloroflexia bacterium]|nr:nucleotidyl transferase AbiEii/AbiGii toxin family protein [Chloroflexia bacterium]